MKKLVQISLLLALAGYFSNANANLLIEPVAGYNLGSKLTFKEDDGESYNGGRGGAYGGRLGFQKLGFQIGLDYLNSNIDMNHNDFDSNLKLSEWAGFIGFEFPVFIRIYAGYIFSAIGETEILTQKIELQKGSGSKVGIGFTGIPFIDINLEIRRGSFEEYKATGTIVEEKVDYSSVMIGLSLPFTL